MEGGEKVKGEMKGRIIDPKRVETIPDLTPYTETPSRHAQSLLI